MSTLLSQGPESSLIHTHPYQPPKYACFFVQQHPRIVPPRYKLTCWKKSNLEKSYKKEKVLGEIHSVVFCVILLANQPIIKQLVNLYFFLNT